MDMRRLVLYAAFILVSYTLWTNWQQDYPPVNQISNTSQLAKPASQTDAMLPAVDSQLSSSADNYQNAEQQTAVSSSKLVQVKTDVLDIAIDLQQGDIVKAALLNYPVSVNEKDKPFPLLTDEYGNRFVANSSIFVVNGQKIQNLDFNYKTTEDIYQLANGQKQLQVKLTGQSSDGLVVSKEYTFTKGSYLIGLRYNIANQSEKPWKGYLNTQLLRNEPKDSQGGMFQISSFTGASYSIPGQQRYKKVPFKNMTKANLDVDSLGGWVAMQQHYFLTAWVPDANAKSRFYTRAMANDYSIGAVSQAIQINPSNQSELNSKLYLGPEDTSILKEISPGLDLTVDYGWLWFLSSFIFSLMRSIHHIVGNWGWSIVLVTVLIKLAFYRLSATSYKSMAAVRKLEPKLRALRERYGDDKAKISQATMELYKQEKVNPLGGCLPVLVQIPVFIALYWVLLESVELRQAPFIFWIKDLTAADPYHVLPLIMGISMLIQQKLNPAPPDPMQARIMMFLPVIFTVFFWNFPSGLVLYSIVNNSLSILQQWYITRKYSDNKGTKKLAVAK